MDSAGTCGDTKGNLAARWYAAAVVAGGLRPRDARTTEEDRPAEEEGVGTSSAAAAAGPTTTLAPPRFVSPPTRTGAPTPPAPTPSRAGPAPRTSALDPRLLPAGPSASRVAHLCILIINK